MALKEYAARQWDHSSVNGLSSKQLEQHYKLYQGYVTNTNTVMKKIEELQKSGSGPTPEYNELKRRFGWEFDGMRMHEVYFDNMAAGKSLASDSALHRALTDTWGSFETWQNDFATTGKVRGIGWVCLYKDANGNLFNQWIGEHEIGHLPGCNLILAMDVWEHAYTVDWAPTERPAYIDVFMKNIDWDTVQTRFSS